MDIVVGNRPIPFNTLLCVNSMNIHSIRKITEIAVWIKEYTHALRVIAGIFFVLALITGFIWISGKDVEPIAFVFGLVSSLLFASPSIAEYLAPDRKPVRYMAYDKILSFIQETNAKSDWKRITTDWAEEAFLKEDPRLRIRVRWDDEGVHVRGFQAPWATKYPDPTANSYWYNLTYDGALIDRFILVSVGGARAERPLPNINTLDVKPLIYRIAQIFNNDHIIFEEHMRGSGLSVKNT